MEGFRAVLRSAHYGLFPLLASSVCCRSPDLIIPLWGRTLTPSPSPGSSRLLEDSLVQAELLQKRDGVSSKPRATQNPQAGGVQAQSAPALEERVCTFG